MHTDQQRNLGLRNRIIYTAPALKTTTPLQATGPRACSHSRDGICNLTLSSFTNSFPKSASMFTNKTLVFLALSLLTVFFSSSYLSQGDPIDPEPKLSEAEDVLSSEGGFDGE